MKREAARNALPDFAGVALVDILANGLAMLIILIALSISARSEHEQRTTAQVEEVETMMSRRFSTSLVLNSLAASPPAQLHDYDNSPIDQILDPQILPIIELHRGFVREYYRGTVWTRAELLREPNAMDAWLLEFDEQRKNRLRVDIYDITQFYLVMSILRDHDVPTRHWHFLDGGLGALAAANCPPGVAAKDCKGEGEQGALAKLAGESGGGQGDGDGEGEGDGEGGGQGEGQWPPQDDAQGQGGQGAGGAPFPGGAAFGDVGGMPGGVPGGQPGGQPGGAAGGIPGGMPGGLPGGEPMLGGGSFPNARPLRAQQLPADLSAFGLLGSDLDAPVQFRRSTPESLQSAQPLDDLQGEAPSIAEVLAVLLTYLERLQLTLELGGSPTSLLENFNAYLRAAFANPPPLRGASAEIVDDLAAQLTDATPSLSDWDKPQATLTIRHRAPLIDTADAADDDDDNAATPAQLIVAPNRRLQSVIVAGGAQPPPPAARPTLHLNAHPDVWRGLLVALEPDSILLMPPVQHGATPSNTTQLKWRALAYIAPTFDDFIVGFAYASIDADGNLQIGGDDNRVRLDGGALRTPHLSANFGARGWLWSLYVVLLLGLFGAVLLTRRLFARG